LYGINRPASGDDPGYLLHIEAIEYAGHVAELDGKKYLRPIQRLVRKIAQIYPATMPLLFTTGSLGLLGGALAFRRDARPLFLIGVGAAAATAIVTRIALLSYLNVTSFLVQDVLYLSPATPFVIVIVVLGNWRGVRALEVFRNAAAAGRPMLPADSAFPSTPCHPD
jgi:hypothetical protein